MTQLFSDFSNQLLFKLQPGSTIMKNAFVVFTVTTRIFTLLRKENDHGNNKSAKLKYNDSLFYYNHG